MVVDEAYVDFGCESACGLIRRFPNLLVVHTLSKGRSLAGLRLGYAMGDAGLIEALDRVKNSFNSYPVDRLAMAGAIAALEDRDHFDRTRRAVMASRRRSIIVRHFPHPRIEAFLRITIGTDAQCRVLVDALKEMLA